MDLQSVGFGSLGKLQGSEVPTAVADGAVPVGAALTWRSCWHTLVVIPMEPWQILLVLGHQGFAVRGEELPAELPRAEDLCLGGMGKCYPGGALPQVGLQQDQARRDTDSCFKHFLAASRAVLCTSLWLLLVSWGFLVLEITLGCCQLKPAIARWLLQPIAVLTAGLYPRGDC